MDVLVHLNYLAIIVSTVAYLATGFVWYTFLPGKAWDQETVGAPAPGANPVLPVLGFLISSTFYVLGTAILLRHFGTGALKGALVSLLATVCFILPINYFHVLFTKKRHLYFIESGFQIFRAVLVGAILGIWN
jgi:hypothetical protein